MKKIAAPTIDKIRNYNRDSVIVDDETTRLLDEMFDYLIANIKYDEKDGEEDYYFEFYYQAKRGMIEDFESFDDCVDYYGITNFDEYLELWEQEYPEENYWYFFQFRKVIYNNRKYYIISINNRIILNVDPLNAKGWKQNRAYLVNFIYDIVKNLIAFASKEDYNEYVKNDLDWKSYFKLLKTKGIENPKPPFYKPKGSHYNIKYLNNSFKIFGDTVRLMISKKEKEYLKEKYNIDDKFIYVSSYIFFRY